MYKPSQLSWQHFDDNLMKQTNIAIHKTRSMKCVCVCVYSTWYQLYIFYKMPHRAQYIKQRQVPYGALDTKWYSLVTHWPLPPSPLSGASQKSIFLLLLEESPQVVLCLGVVPLLRDWKKKQNSYNFFPQWINRLRKRYFVIQDNTPHHRWHWQLRGCYPPLWP
jgi:hypothetical protein